jgi:hypothetical protein
MKRNHGYRSLLMLEKLNSIDKVGDCAQVNIIIRTVLL